MGGGQFFSPYFASKKVWSPGVPSPGVSDLSKMVTSMNQQRHVDMELCHELCSTYFPALKSPKHAAEMALLPLMMAGCYRNFGEININTVGPTTRGRSRDMSGNMVYLHIICPLSY